MHAAAELAAAMRTAQPGTYGARATSSGSTILNMHDARHAVGFVNMRPGGFQSQTARLDCGRLFLSSALQSTVSL